MRGVIIILSFDKHWQMRYCEIPNFIQKDKIPISNPSIPISKCVTMLQWSRNGIPYLLYRCKGFVSYFSNMVTSLFSIMAGIYRCNFFIRPLEINCMFCISSRIHFAQKSRKKNTHFFLHVLLYIPSRFTLCLLFTVCVVFSLACIAFPKDFEVKHTIYF